MGKIHNTVKEILLLFIVACFGPMLILSFLFFRNYQAQYSKLSISQFKQQVDHVSNNIYNDINFIQNNIKNTLLKNKYFFEFEAQDCTDFIYIRKKLSELLYMGPFRGNILFYRCHRDTLYSPSQVSTLQDYLKGQAVSDEISKRIHECMDTSVVTRALFDRDSSLTYIIVPFEVDHGVPLSQIIVTIPDTYFKKELMPIEQISQGDITMRLNKHVLFSLESKETITDPMKYFTQTTYLEVEVSLPKRCFSLFSSDFFITYIFYILLCLAGGCCFVLIFVKKHYVSISAVSDTVNMITKGQDASNIFEKANKTLMQLYHQNNKISSENMRYRTDNLILALSASEEASSSANMDNILHQLEIDIRGPYYCCIILNHYIIEETNYYSSDQTQIYAFNYVNSSLTVLLIGTSDSTRQNQQSIIDLVVKEEHMDEYNLIYTIGVGCFVCRREELHASYIQALKAINSKKGNDSKVIYYTDIDDNNQHNYDICSKLIHNFCKTIYEEEFNRIELESQNLRSILMSNSSDTLCNLLCLEFTFKVVAVLEAKNVKIDRQFLDCYRYRLFRSKLTKQECDQYLYDLITPLSKQLTENQAGFMENSIEKDTLTMEHLLNFIHQNISNPELSVNYIAEHFHVSQSNLSHFFKKHKEASISEYIKSLKIELIKKMLVETSLSVNQIAEKTGYYQPSSFIRMFKASTDMTPAEYRNAYYKQ